MVKLVNAVRDAAGNGAGIFGFMLLIAPLLLVNVVLLAASQLWASVISIQIFSSLKLIYSATIFPILFLGSLLSVFIFESIWRANEFTNNETCHINVRGLWRASSFRASPLKGALIIFAMGLGITSSSHLSEIYRLTTQRWFDERLWMIEEPVFGILLGSWLNIPIFWDKVYFFIWPALFVSIAVVYKFGDQQKLLKIALAAVIAFHVARMINLLFPTAGPVFFKPELFSLEGTLSDRAQEGLRLYMLGHLAQNGLIPGTMAMPSLHVGLAAMTVWTIASQWRWTLWLTIPWLLLIWMSTVMLGWHYALDGIGGIFVTGLSILMAHHILRAWQTLAATVQFEDSCPL